MGAPRVFPHWGDWGWGVQREREREEGRKKRVKEGISPP